MTDGSPAQMLVHRNDHQVLGQKHEASLPTSPLQTSAESHQRQASRRASMKENAEDPSLLTSGQRMLNDVTEAQGSEQRANLPDVVGTKASPAITPSRKRSGSTVKLSLPLATDQDQSPKPSGSRGSAGPEDPKFQHRPSHTSLLQVLNILKNERSGEHRAGKSSSDGLDYGGRRDPEVLFRVAGVPITKSCAILTISIVIVTVLTIFVVILLTRQRRTVPTQPFCETEDCFHHSYRLLGKLNRSLDPCENFSAYVCSAWSPPEGYLKHSNSAMDDVRKSWFPAFREMLREGSETIKVGLKPLAMYSSCMGTRSEYGSNVEIFWDMLKECGLTWPEEPEPGKTSALDVLMTLAYKWQLPLFFQVRVLRLKSASKWRFTMDPGSLIPLMYQHHVTVQNSGGYEKYWATFYIILSDKRNEAPVNKTVIASAKAMEGDVFKKLLTAMRPPVVRPVLVPMSQIGPYTPSLNSDQWLRAFRQTDLEPEVELQDQVLLGDAGFFLALARVMNSYEDTQLMSLIAWSFVQLLSPAMDYRLLENRYEQGVSIYRPYFCERFVETAYRFLVLALASASRFSLHEREFVSAGFQSLVSAAVDMVNVTEWLDVESRQLAAGKLSSTRLHLWPPENFLKDDVLGNIYEAFPSSEASFAEYWVKSRRCAAEAYLPRDDIDFQSYSFNYALPYLLYDATNNSVKVAVGAVTAPLYYASGTNAMFYGGLGFSMALELVASLNSQGLMWHPDGTFGDSFLSNASARAFEIRDGCLTSAEKQRGANAKTNQSASEIGISVFPEIPALEVAYMAYQRSLSERSDNTPQGIPKVLSGDQVFFMTLCYMMCTLPDAVGPHTVDCNKAVRNSEAFSRAFRCPLGSQMNPKQKCSFFG
ncbi:hypothetical protein HPB49_018103 [Dermacentor silvarum]|uniref:Uncharacterized protein n=1 Tax=Dermacentor silvarum TaxID=543639 RepID=A0ACB8D779_DERSI|nr:endothelin-converting enzyme 1 [Dermacentor silvarum]KAH7960243.1 hypothetical protein HPB49_018103 [Dermacentor silvarum]